MFAIARALMHPQPLAIKRFQGPSTARLKKVPAISVRVGKDRDRTINLMARLFQKANAARNHGFIVAGKIVGIQEKSDTAAGLVADGKPLLFAIRLGEQQGATLGALRLDHKPPFAVVKRLIGEALEAENIAIKRLCPIIVIDDKRNQRDAAVFRKGHQPTSVSAVFLPRLRTALLTMPISAPPETKASTK